MENSNKKSYWSKPIFILWLVFLFGWIIPQVSSDPNLVIVSGFAVVISLLIGIRNDISNLNK